MTARSLVSETCTVDRLTAELRLGHLDRARAVEHAARALGAQREGQPLRAVSDPAAAGRLAVRGVERPVAGVADAVVVVVSLARVRHEPAVVAGVVDAVAVVVGVAGVALAVAVGVLLVGVGERDAVVGDVADRVVVVVAVAGVAEAVAVRVGLIAVGGELAVVVAVLERVAVIVAVARVALPVAVVVGLAGVHRQRAVVLGVVARVVVVVAVARVAVLVAVPVELVGVRHGGAVVAVVEHAVAVAVDRVLRQIDPDRALLAAVPGVLDAHLERVLAGERDRVGEAAPRRPAAVADVADACAEDHGARAARRHDDPHGAVVVEGQDVARLEERPAVQHVARLGHERLHELLAGAARRADETEVPARPRRVAGVARGRGAGAVPARRRAGLEARVDERELCARGGCRDGERRDAGGRDGQVPAQEVHAISFSDSKLVQRSRGHRTWACAEALLDVQ